MGIKKVPIENLRAGFVAAGASIDDDINDESVESLLKEGELWLTSILAAELCFLEMTRLSFNASRVCMHSCRVVVTLLK